MAFIAARMDFNTTLKSIRHVQQAIGTGRKAVAARNMDKNLRPKFSDAAIPPTLMA